MGSGASKTTGKAIKTHARSNGKQTAIENTYHSEERHNKLSQDAKSANGNVKDECNATTREGKPVTDRFSAENKQMTIDVGDEKILISSFCENDPQLETRLSSTNRHYQSLNKAFHDGNLLTEPLLEHAKALIDVYSKCRKRSNKTVVTDFALAVGIHKLVYDIIVDRRSNYPEITTWDRNVRKDTEKEEQGNQEEANDDTLVGDENKVNLELLD